MSHIHYNNKLFVRVNIYELCDLANGVGQQEMWNSGNALGFPSIDSNYYW